MAMVVIILQYIKYIIIYHSILSQHIILGNIVCQLHLKKLENKKNVTSSLALKR